jgi:hypothetical protein
MDTILVSPSEVRHDWSLLLTGSVDSEIRILFKMFVLACCFLNLCLMLIPFELGNP